MSVDVEVVVVGGGAMGAATAWQLAARGVSVHVVEQFAPGHTRGASHGASRNFNVGYEHPRPLAWLREAVPLWRRLEDESGESLLEITGIVNHGPGRDLATAAQAVRAGGFDAELVDPRAARHRWPQFRFDGPVLHTPDAGRLHADKAVRALHAGARRDGAAVLWETKVLSFEPDEKRVRVTVLDEDGRRAITASRVVVTAGAWTASLVGGRVPLPSLRVTQEQPAHFAAREAGEGWPGFNHSPSSDDPATSWFPASVYGMHTPGAGVKAGWHAAGPVVDPDTRSFQPDPALTAQLRRYAREWLPGADPDRFSEVTCTYTSTPDAQFVLERCGRIVVGAGFSGHGFKFTPVIGRILADLATAPE
ncbi:MAG: FAD-dependent oxidoreductase [Microbacterium sp.]